MAASVKEVWTIWNERKTFFEKKKKYYGSFGSGMTISF